jgi:hypothetical protein
MAVLPLIYIALMPKTPIPVPEDTFCDSSEFPDFWIEWEPARSWHAMDRPRLSVLSFAEASLYIMDHDAHPLNTVLQLLLRHSEMMAPVLDLIGFVDVDTRRILRTAF